ncbi:MAG: DUF1579 family protein [Planctomycetes bacterium]|nr:DUF1579 family protein [Planctomycetota bacterium]
MSGSDGCESGAMPGMQKLPQHDQLQRSVGTWDGAMTAWSPDGQEITSKGVMVSTAHGDFHTIDSYEGEVMGAPYVGHGINSYCPLRKQFMSTWTDSMSGCPLQLTGQYDEATKTTTLHGEAMGPTGMAPCSTKTTFVSDDRIDWEFYGEIPGVGPVRFLRIEYTRRA